MTNKSNNFTCESDSVKNKNYNKDHLLEHHYTLWDEIICHFPIAIFSVAFSIIVLSFLFFFDTNGANTSGAHLLFHNFHILHLLFAATGTVLTFRKYSQKILLAILVGFFVPSIFCTLSDVLFPYCAGILLGIKMEFHWCFFHNFVNVSPFLFMGMLNGWFMSEHSSNKKLFYSQGFHFLHIFISAMASILYLVSYGFGNWFNFLGIIFVLLILIVLIPCTLSDIVVPILFAKSKK
ncbi:hypothetical protein ACFLYH_00855 [Candidatus Dependentiae bacterium]